MIIALDIDGTLVDSGSLVYKILNIFPKKVLGISKKSSKLFDTTKIYKKTTLNKVFACLNPKQYREIDNAVETINYFSKNNVIIILSSRPANLKCIDYLTKANITSSKINADLVFLGVKNKAQFCKEQNIDIFIDNNITTCISVAEHSKAKSICYSPKSNNTHEGVIIAGSWLHLFYKVNDIVQNSASNQQSKQEVIESIKAQYSSENQMEK